MTYLAHIFSSESPPDKRIDAILGTRTSTYIQSNFRNSSHICDKNVWPQYLLFDMRFFCVRAGILFR